MKPRSVVAVEDLRKAYPSGVEALRGLWFSVAEGEIYGLLGPNGAGKSTALSILTTVIRASGGRADVAGYDTRRRGIDVRRCIGVVFQDTVLDNELTARENLELHARLWRMPRWEEQRRIGELLSMVGLTSRADANVRSYSGGMRRRLEIARALLAGPQVIFLDEPTTGLDPTIRDALWQLIQRLRREEGVTVVLTTHYLEEAASVCDRVAIVDHGRVIAEGQPGALVEGLGPELIELRVDVDPASAAAALASTGLGSQPPLIRGDIVTLPVRSGVRPDQVAAQVAAVAGDGLAIASSTIRRPTLADVYAHRIGAAPAEVHADGLETPA